MSWNGCALTTVMSTAPGTAPSSSNRLAAPSAAHSPANPDPRTRTREVPDTAPSSRRTGDLDKGSLFGLLVSLFSRRCRGFAATTPRRMILIRVTSVQPHRTPAKPRQPANRRIDPLDFEAERSGLGTFFGTTVLFSAAAGFGVHLHDVFKTRCSRRRSCGAVRVDLGAVIVAWGQGADARLRQAEFPQVPGLIRRHSL